jgi:WD40 repeat protein
MMSVARNRFVCIMQIVCLFLAVLALFPQCALGDDAAGQIREVATIQGYGGWNSVAFSPDGRLIASGSIYGAVTLWDAERRIEIANLGGHRDLVRSIAFSHDCRLIASGSADNTVRLWDVERRKEIPTLMGHENVVTAVAFSPDGLSLASGSWDNTVKLWDVDARTRVATLIGHLGRVTVVTFSPDGRLIASGGYDKSVRLWDVEQRKAIATLKGHESVVTAVAFSPDGRLLASSSADNTVKLWDVKQRAEITKLKGHKGSVWSVAFSPDGRLLASGGADATVKLWDVELRKEISTLKGHSRRVCAIAFSPDGKSLASGGEDNTVKQWDVSSVAKSDVAPRKPKYNPSLEVSASFTEPSGDNILEESETATIYLLVRNTGKGEAYNVQSALEFTSSASHSGISVGHGKPCPRLDPGDLKVFTMELIADERVTDQTVELQVQVLEANGFDSDPVALRFQTRATRAPEFAITEWAIDDDSQGESQGNGNLQFELGEIAEVTLRVTNSGEGPARDAVLKIGLPRSPNVFYQSSSSDFVLGDLLPGVSKDITFAISTNKRFQGDHIALSVQFTDARPRFNSTSNFQLPLEQRTVPLTPIEIQPVVIAQDKVEVLPSLTSIVDTDIPVTGMRNPDAVAVVIGNSHYTDRHIPPVEFALRDAAVIKKYLVSTLGYDANNILYYTDAGLGDLNSVFGREGRPKGRLYDYVKPGISDVFVYYSGHGAPDVDSRQAYFLPSDCDRDDLVQTAYSRNTLFENLTSLPARSITVVLDACFSGMSDAGSLMGDISPLVIEVEPSASLPNGTVFSSSAADQVSTWYREQKHGLFTYFFLMGIRGEADGDGDAKITVQELEDYLTDPANGVPYMARRLKSTEQMPVVVTSDRNKTIVELR